MIITQTFTMARWQIVVKTSEATKQTKTKMTTKTNKQTNKQTKQQQLYVTAVGTSPVRSNLCAPLNCCFNSCAKQSHNDNVRSTTVEEHLKERLVQLSEPSSTSLLFISPGLC